ncbi:integrase core domain-containing protein [Treponema phagedenis]|uniref:integrase core domain-containing protein n=1 Tax=Treponema phagedenis TaxID=162 RepID=UPI00209190C7|nr:integrase core domain-containing protein [Treponema phagedenis]
MRQPGAGVIVHSDAGSQFTSIAYKQTLGKFKAIQSMSDVGKCYDNARMESFFATLKKELLYRIDTTKMTREQVKTLVWQYTMVYYNRKRISTVNEDGLPPTFYRLKVTKKRWSGLNIHLGDKNTELILTFPELILTFPFPLSPLGLPSLLQRCLGRCPKNPS